MIWSGCGRSPVAQEKADDTVSTLVESDSATYAQQKMALAGKLQILMDSIDSTMQWVRHDSTAFTEGLYQGAMTNLKLTRDRVERDLVEVNTTALNAWDDDYVDRITLNSNANWRQLRVILDDLGKR
jgi:hypothetical protein